jgi:hypothetical protein
MQGLLNSLMRLRPRKPQQMQTEVEREAAFWANRFRLLNAHAQRLADYCDSHPPIDFVNWPGDNK